MSNEPPQDGSRRLKTFKYLLCISIALTAFSAFAAQPQLQFDLNSDGKSYTLQIDNQSDATISCISIEIIAEIGNPGCTRISPDFNQTIRNIKILKGSAVVDSNFGKDQLFLVSRGSKPDETKVFCGQPEVKINCH